MEYIPSLVWFSLPPSQTPHKDSIVGKHCQLVEAVCNTIPVDSCWESMTWVIAKAGLWEQRSLGVFLGEYRVEMGLE